MQPYYEARFKVATNGLRPCVSRVASKKINAATLLRKGAVIGSCAAKE